MDEIPADANITAATLVLNCFDPGSSAEASIVSGAWDESSITWSNKPGSGGAITTFSPGTGAVGINVLTAVEAWVGGQPNYGLRLHPTGTNGSDYDSSETGNAPVLQVTMSY